MESRQLQQRETMRTANDNMKRVDDPEHLIEQIEDIIRAEGGLPVPTDDQFLEDKQPKIWEFLYKGIFNP